MAGNTATDELMVQALGLLQNKITQCGQMLQKKNEVMLWKGQVISQPDQTQKDGMNGAIGELIADMETIIASISGTFSTGDPKDLEDLTNG